MLLIDIENEIHKSIHLYGEFYALGIKFYPVTCSDPVLMRI